MKISTLERTFNMQTKLTPKPNKQLTTYLNNLYDLTDQFDDLTDKIKSAKNHELTQETITDLCEDIIGINLTIYQTTAQIENTLTIIEKSINLVCAYIACDSSGANLDMCSRQLNTINSLIGDIEND